MSTSTDPPSVERKNASVGKRLRTFGRKLVNRRTLIVAFQLAYWAVRIHTALRQFFGGL